MRIGTPQLLERLFLLSFKLLGEATAKK